MKRADNLLFTLFAFRCGILERDQLMAICKSLRHGKDIDIGMSLAKRGLIDERQMEAVWALAAVQAEVCGSAKKALQTVDAGELVQQAIWTALKPIPAKDQAGGDPPTIKFD